MERIGELAAFGTAVCWTISPVLFETASRRVGTLAVNFYKVLGASILLAVTSLILKGCFFPADAPARVWIWMSVSGLVGFAIADIFLFNAYLMIGSRMTMLFGSLSPPMTAFFGRIVLGERMPPLGLSGMVMVCAGIAAAVAGRRKNPAVERPQDRSRRVLGYLFAFLSAAGQSVSMILTKIGSAGYDTVSGTQIRVLAGMIGFAVIILVTGNGRKVFFQAPRDGVGMRWTAAGSVFGPFVGVTLSVFALQNALAGTVSSLIGLTPVLIIPPSVIFLKQKIGAWEVLGALLAVGGTIVFFL